MNTTMRIGLGVATAATLTGLLIGGSELTSAPALAADELHNVTYVARIDGIVPGARATFKINDTDTNTAPLSSLPGQVFEANTVLSDPSKAGMQVSIPWPYSANVHCEVKVDDTVTAQLDQFVTPKPGDRGPSAGLLSCGAPISDGSSATGAN